MYSGGSGTRSHQILKKQQPKNQDTRNTQSPINKRIFNVPRINATLFFLTSCFVMEQIHSSEKCRIRCMADTSLEEHPAPKITPDATVLSLQSVPDPTQPLRCFVNGVEFHQGSDYTVNGQLLVFKHGYGPVPTDTINVFYNPLSPSTRDATVMSTNSPPIVQTDPEAKQRHDAVAFLLAQTAPVTWPAENSTTAGQAAPQTRAVTPARPPKAESLSKRRGLPVSQSDGEALRNVSPTGNEEPNSLRVLRAMVADNVGGATDAANNSPRQNTTLPPATATPPASSLQSIQQP